MVLVAIACGGSKLPGTIQPPDGGVPQIDSGMPPQDSGTPMQDSGLQPPPGQGGITCAPLAIDFGTVAGNIGATLPVVCTNTSELSVEVIGLAASATVFSALVDPGSSSTMGPGQSTQIDVTYLPATAETDTGTLTIAVSAGVGAVVVSLTGNAIVENVCTYSITPAEFGLGEVLVGTEESFGFTITVLAGTCSVTDVHLSAQTSPALTLTDVSQSAEAVVIDILFAPTEPGNFSGAVNYTVNGTVQSISFSAWGTDDYCFLLMPMSIDFGTVGMGDGQVCENGKQTFVGVNGCAQAVMIQSATVSSGGAIFSLPDSVAQVVAQGGTSAPIEVDFVPTSTGMFTGTVSVQTDLQSRPFSLTLSGSGADAQMETDSFTFSSSTLFPLSATPLPSSVQVTVNGALLSPSDWSLDKDVLTIDSTVVLNPGDFIEVSYLECA